LLRFVFVKFRVQYVVCSLGFVFITVSFHYGVYSSRFVSVSLCVR